MSEIEPPPEPIKTETVNDESILEPSVPSSEKEKNPATSNIPATSNGAAANPATGPSAPHATKRFSSASINKKFLQKTVSAQNSATSPLTANNASPTPAPAKATPSATNKPSSTSNAPRLVTTKLTQTTSSSTSKWSKDVTGDGTKAGASGSDNSSSKPTLPVAKSVNKNQTSPTPGKAVWGSVSSLTKTNTRVQNDFPTAAELKDRADKAAAASAAQRRSMDAFRGLHLDPKVQHWDEMTEEDTDFLTGVIEFGDGKQYKVAPAKEEPEAPRRADLTEDRLGNDYDRSWPASKENEGVSPSSSVKTSNHPSERVLFNDRHNRMETIPRSRQPHGAPTLLSPTPSSIRGANGRRGSENKGYRESTGWNPRGYHGDSADRDTEGRDRHPSSSERDKFSSQGGLGPHLRDRSPDRSGRFPGRHIPAVSRRDSQASSAMVGSGPARSTRALSRDSSDRGGGGRQLPPHLAAASPVAPPSATSSIPPRTSWRGSPTNVRSPASIHAQTRPISHISDTSNHPPGSEHDTTTSPATEKSNDVTVLASLVQDEGAFKASMATAAERARKRRQEEEEEREKERERAKAKLLELEKRIQADKEAKEREEKEKKEAEEREAKSRAEHAEKERVGKEKVEQGKKEKAGPPGRERGSSSARTFPPPRSQIPADRADSWRSSRLPSTAEASSNQPKPDPHEPKTMPAATLEPQQAESQTSTTVVVKLNKSQSDQSRKPENLGQEPERAIPHSHYADDRAEVLGVADLHQLAEGYQNKLQSQNQGLSVSTVVNGIESSPVTHPIVNLKPGYSAESKGFPRSDEKHSRAQPPAPLNLAPRGPQESGQVHSPRSATNAPGSAGPGSARSPRAFDPSHPPYRQASISVLDDTMSRFKAALLHSNPQHAGMSSDDIMEGLAHAEATGGRSFVSQMATVQVRIAMMLSKEPDAITSASSWSQSQVVEAEEVDAPSVLIPTLSYRRPPVPQQRLRAMKQAEPWRWDILTFDPPVQSMSRRTLSVSDALVEPASLLPGRLRVRIPGQTVRVVPYGDPSNRLPPMNGSRPRRDETRPNTLASTTPNVNGVVPGPKSAPSNSQWPPRSKGSDEPVWRRAVPVTAVPERASSAAALSGSPKTPLTSKSVPGSKHSRSLASQSPARTPPTGIASLNAATTTWGRSPLNLTVTEDLPEDPTLKAAWNKASSNIDIKVVKNSLEGIADDPPPHIPSSINELKSEDGDSGKAAEKDPSPPARLKYNPHKAFQTISSQPPAPQSASPATVPSTLSSTQPTPRSNALALTTNRTPRQASPSSLPPIHPAAPQNALPTPSRAGIPVPYPPQMPPAPSPYNQPMMQSQYTPSTPIMGPPTPNMMPSTVNPGVQMQPPVQTQPVWPQQGPPSQMGYMRQMQGPLPPPVPYQPQVMQHPGSQSLQLYMTGSPGVIHPPSPGMSPLNAPGMGKPPPPMQRQNSLPMPNAQAPSSGLPVSVPVTFQMGPPAPPVQQPQQMGYMMGSPLAAHGTPHQQMPPHQMRPPQGRGMPLHTPQYPQPAPNGYPRPW